MTTAQRKGLEYAMLVVGSVATIAMSAGYARRELETKEDRTNHERDVTILNDKIRDERQNRALQQIRDSAQMSILVSRITEVACDQNPRRRYC